MYNTTIIETPADNIIIITVYNEFDEMVTEFNNIDDFINFYNKNKHLFDEPTESTS